MKVMAYYIVIVIIGALACWGIGLVVEKFSETASLPVFLACFFLNFCVSWRIALWLTEPKTRRRRNKADATSTSPFGEASPQRSGSIAAAADRTRRFDSRCRAR